ncbi:MAG TPA: dolichyl-phosphate beta-glucosyltransferase [Methylomirabilota bacterium]|nr:dolichyl-phosphate beta-glucosyltransferase [Methylomirabilota bacterium]
MNPVAIVVPCYNESARFPLGKIRDFIARGSIDFVFVDDGSRDATFEVLESLRRECPNRVTVLRQPINRGKAEAVRVGMLQAMNAGYAYVGFWDADLATPLEEVPKLLEVLDDQRIQIVFGSRVRLLGRKIERKPARHYVGRVFATTVSLLLGIPVYDTQCGAKLFRVTDAARRLFDRPFLSRWVFDVEILARHGSTDGIYEFPLHAWEDVRGSKLRAKDFFVSFFDILRIWRSYRNPSPANRSGGVKPAPLQTAAIPPRDK